MGRKKKVKVVQYASPQEVTTRIANDLIEIIKDAGLAPTEKLTVFDQAVTSPHDIIGSNYHRVARRGTGLDFKVKYDVGMLRRCAAIVTGSGAEDENFIQIPAKRDPNGKLYSKVVVAKQAIENYLGAIGVRGGHLYKPAYRVCMAAVSPTLDELASERQKAREAAEEPPEE